MRRFILGFLLFFGILRAGSEEELTKSLNQSGMFLYYLINKSHNTIFSPLACNGSLLMVYMGAKGQTAYEIASALHLTLPQSEVAATYQSLVKPLYSSIDTFMLGSSLWIDDRFEILSSYKDIVQTDFNGSLHTVDFSKPVHAAHEINKWVYTYSKNKISSFINPKAITNQTKMILMNSLYLRGRWESPFPTQNTGVRPFLTSEGSPVDCKMMRQESELYYFENQDTKVVALPIESDGAHLAFVIFLPKKEVDDLYNFYYSQDESKPEGFLSYLRELKKTYLNLNLPRFLISQKLDLKPLFRALGINSATSSSADFSGIDGKKDLMLNQVAHESLLSIDEGGLFATAASGFSFGFKSKPRGEPIDVMANRPFLYAVMDFDTKLILFLGECHDPSQTGIIEHVEEKS